MKDVAEALRQEGQVNDGVAAVETLPERLRELLAREETSEMLDEIAGRRLRDRFLGRAPDDDLAYHPWADAQPALAPVGAPHT